MITSEEFNNKVASIKQDIERYERLIEDHRNGGNDGVVECLSKVVCEIKVGLSEYIMKYEQSNIMED